MPITWFAPPSAALSIPFQAAAWPQHHAIVDKLVPALSGSAQTLRSMR